MEQMDNLIYLTDENGEELVFEFIDLVEYNGNEYVALLSIEESDDEIVILRVEKKEDSEGFCSVDKEDELMAVFHLFQEKVFETTDEEKELIEEFNELFGE